MLDCILELVLPLVPGAVITVGLIWWLTFVLENYGLGLFFLFLSTITAYVIILFGGVLQACCNRCIDKYIEGCMRRGADDEDLDWAVGDLCSTKDGALFTVADTSHGVALAQLSSNATSSQRLYSPHEIDDVERVATATYISREFTKLEAAVADRDGADTFEMAALGVNRTRGTKSSSPFRALLCCFIQTVAPGLLLLQMVGTHDKQGGALCPWDQGWDLWYTKLTSKGLGVALMLYMYNYVMTAQYKWEAKPSHELLRLGAVLDCYEQPLWACLGLVSNGCALVWGSIGSCVLIFLAESPIDIVLNSMALFFLLEVDDNIVDPNDYKHAKLHLARWSASGAPDSDVKPVRVAVSPMRGTAVLRVQTAIRISRYLISFAGPLWIAACK